MPTRKVSAAGLGGAIAVLVAWGLSLGGVELPPEPAAALAAILSAVLGYLVPEKSTNG